MKWTKNCGTSVLCRSHSLLRSVPKTGSRRREGGREGRIERGKEGGREGGREGQEQRVSEWIHEEKWRAGVCITLNDALLLQSLNLGSLGHQSSQSVPNTVWREGERRGGKK